MAPTETEIRTLLASQSYSPSSVPALEEYLAAQAAGDAPYVADAVRTLLKLYQLFPETAKDVNLGHACLLALLEYPSTDLLALTYLLPQTALTQEPCATIVQCSELLDDCKFAEFWKVYNEKLQQSSDAVMAGLASRNVQRLQGAILGVLALSYRTAPASVVLQAVNESSTDALLSHKEVVESATSDSVVFVASADNTKRKRVYEESVNFATIGSLMAKMAQ